LAVAGYGSRERRIKRPASNLAAGELMAAPRKVFRIEEMAGGRLEPPPNRAPAPHGDIAEELSALRAMFAAAAPVHVTEHADPRPNEIERLASELRLVRSVLSASGQKHSSRGGPQAAGAHIPRELEAVMQGSKQATQKILAAAEDIDMAANNLTAALKDTCEQGLAQDIRDRVIQIFEACNFQDLTSQRVAKVMATLSGLERQIAGALDQLTRADAAPAVHGPRLPGDPGHVSQSDVDCLFAGDARSA
jgi:chemotaxis protein CheZ